jgi:hypothetical protein
VADEGEGGKLDEVLNVRLDQRPQLSPPRGRRVRSLTIWLAILASLLVVAAAEVAVSFELTTVGKSVGHAILAVIGVGLLPVLAAALMYHRRMRPKLPPLNRHVLLAGAIILPLVVGAWSYRGAVVTLRFRLTEESRLASFVTLANRDAARWRDGCAPGYDFPAVPGLGNLEWVCSSRGTDPQVEFDGRGYSNGVGVAYIWSPHGTAETIASDECVFHLDGPWWMLTNGLDGTACPLGWNGVGGG